MLHRKNSELSLISFSRTHKDSQQRGLSFLINLSLILSLCFFFWHKCIFSRMLQAGSLCEPGVGEDNCPSSTAEAPS